MLIDMTVSGTTSHRLVPFLFPVISLFLLLVCLIRSPGQPLFPRQSAIESQWQTLRAMAPPELKLQLIHNPVSHLVGANDRGEIVWRGMLSSVLAPEIQGWSGPISLALAIDPEGRILDLRILGHTETPSFFRGLEEDWFLAQFKGKPTSSSLEPGTDIDGITQASVSVRAFCATIKACLARLSSPSSPPAAAAPNLWKGETLPVFFLLGALLIMTGRNQLGPRVTSLLILLLIGLLSPQFVSFAHLGSVQRLVHEATLPSLSTSLFFFVALVLSLTTPRGYCQRLCPAGQLQILLSGLTALPTSSVAESSPPHAPLPPAGNSSATEPIPAPTFVGRILFWGGLAAFIFFPTFPLHQFEVFPALFFRNQGAWGGVLVVSFLAGSLLSHRWYCRTLCPLNPLFSDAEALRPPSPPNRPPTNPGGLAE